jgi:hypothetical protein
MFCWLLTTAARFSAQGFAFTQPLFQKKETLYTKGIMPFVWSVPDINRIFYFVSAVQTEMLYLS